MCLFVLAVRNCDCMRVLLLFAFPVVFVMCLCCARFALVCA